MYVVGFTDWTPTARFDSLPWTQARIEESMNREGPWVALEVKNITPLDTDPAHPKSRSFTTELATIQTGGWYRIVWLDSTGDQEQPTTPIQNTPAYSYTPTNAMVGGLLRTRTIIPTGQELGYFTMETRPTSEEVQGLIQVAVRDVSRDLGREVPAEFYDDARGLTALRTAMLVELTYFPEQVAANISPYEQYKVLYDENLIKLLEAISRDPDADPDTGTGGMPEYYFPANDGGLVGWQTVM
jgi:hypothetical protein